MAGIAHDHIRDPLPKDQTPPKSGRFPGRGSPAARRRTTVASVRLDRYAVPELIHHPREAADSEVPPSAELSTYLGRPHSQPGGKFFLARAGGSQGFMNHLRGREQQPLFGEQRIGFRCASKPGCQRAWPFSLTDFTSCKITPKSVMVTAGAYGANRSALPGLFA